MNIEKFIMNTNEILNEKLKELELLEEEKRSLINQYKIVNTSERVLLEVEIKKSEKKFKVLLDEVNMISLKVKKLKKQYC